jgi:hypothetical protein
MHPAVNMQPRNNKLDKLFLTPLLPLLLKLLLEQHLRRWLTGPQKDPLQIVTWLGSSPNTYCFVRYFLYVL